MMNRRTVEARLEDQWHALRALVSAFIYRADATSADAYRSVGIEDKYHQLLNSVRHDRMVGASCMLGLYRAPGSKDRHHAYEGGLVAHLLEMWSAWKNILRPAIIDSAPTEFINDSLVLRAIIHHDLNKVHRYRLVSIETFMVVHDVEQVEIPWSVDYGTKNEDPLGHLLPSTHKSLQLLMDAGITLDPLLHNALVTAEGGFTEGKRPRTESVFAKVIYILDELSANVFGRLNPVQFWDSKGGFNGA